jgi:hypothetical protein
LQPYKKGAVMAGIDAQKRSDYLRPLFMGLSPLKSGMTRDTHVHPASKGFL